MIFFENLCFEVLPNYPPTAKFYETNTVILTYEWLDAIA